MIRFQYGTETAIQNSTLFSNKSGSFHELRVDNLDGCVQVIRSLFIIQAPNFITPNNDVYNHL
jgi:hypothetical protein